MCVRCRGRRGLPLSAPEVSQVWAAYQQLDETQWFTPAELENLQLRQLKMLLRHCYQHVPSYTGGC